MKSMKNKTCATIAAGFGVAGLLATSANATIFAYEGFAGVGDGALVGQAATGSGFTGSWAATNGTGAASTTESGGLAYPGSYPGSNVAVGGNGRVTGAPGANAFVALSLGAVADFQVNGASEVHIAWLAEIRNVDTDTHNAALDRVMWDLAAEYPRNAGLRVMADPTGNSALGTIGNGGNWNGNNQSVYNVGDSNPEVVDTWAAFNFNDVNNLFVGNGGAGPGEPDPSPNYNPAGAHYDGIDHLVLSITAATSTYRLQVNPQADGSNDGEFTFVHTDGAVVPFALKRIGFEGGSEDTDRAAGDMVFDEIYIADTFEDAAGFVQVPEPSVALLGGLGLLGLMRRRRA